MSKEVQFVNNNLKIILEEYRKIRPNLSIRSIARSMGVNRYFLMKINDSSNTTKLDLSQTLVFWKYIRNSDLSNEKIKTHIENLKKYLVDLLGFTDDNKILDIQTPEIDLYDRGNFFTLLLASCDPGLTREDIISVLGENCKENLKQLLELGHVIEDANHHIIIPEKRSLYFTTRLVRYHLFDIISFYKEHSDAGYLHLVTQSLNDDGLKKALAVQKDYANKMLDLVTDKKHWGNNPFFSVLCSDCFSKRLTSDEKT